MPKILVLICFLLFTNCAKVETASNDFAKNDSNKIVTVSPTINNEIFLKPVTPNIKLNAKQQKYLDESLPPKVREVLEKAEKLEILAEVHNKDEDDDEGTIFEPNRILKFVNEKDKKEILEAFYHDASREDSPAVCYYPRHLIRGIYQGKKVEVEICFTCARFFVRGDFGDFDGTIVRENRKSEDFFKQIIESKGVEFKK